MFVINSHAGIQARGGGVYGDDDFEIVACANCGCQYLYNSEVLELYYDPQDLSRRYLNAEGYDIPPCRQCGIEDWSFEELSVNDKAKVETGAWSWALKE
jgi:hypothetical protein